VIEKLVDVVIVAVQRDALLARHESESRAQSSRNDSISRRLAA
jgi:hypothetical protein